MGKKEEIQARLDKRLEEMSNCKTTTELAYTIWSKSFEEATGGSKQDYRNCFKEWIEAYREKRPPNLWNRYKTPIEVADAIWQPFLDRESDKLWFTSLRKGLIDWIEKYANKIPLSERQKDKIHIAGYKLSIIRTQIELLDKELEKCIDEQIPLSDNFCQILDKFPVSENDEVVKLLTKKVIK
jgi:hypothetical protein